MHHAVPLVDSATLGHIPFHWEAVRWIATVLASRHESPTHHLFDPQRD